MKTALLRAATSRSIGSRTWAGLTLGPDTGQVSFGTRNILPKRDGQWFHWNFHEHAGGAGGLRTTEHKGQIRTMVRNLIKHQ